MSKWVADKVERKSVDDLIPYERNPKIHTDKQIMQLANSIKQWGWTIPILIDEENTVLAGHGRLFAAQLLGLKQVPTMLAKGWTEEQKKSYIIADNKLSIADWDEELLKLEIEELKSGDFDLSLTGFDEGELLNLYLEKLEGINDANEEWEGMPDYEALDPCYRKIIVNFDTPEDVEDFFKLVNQSHTDKTKSIWYPEKENRNLKDTRWADE